MTVKQPGVTEKWTPSPPGPAPRATQHRHLAGQWMVILRLQMQLPVWVSWLAALFLTAKKALNSTIASEQQLKRTSWSVL